MKRLLLLLLLLPILILGAKTVLDLRRGAAVVPANIIVDTSLTQGKIQTSLWQNFSQGGEEAKDMIAPIISLVKNLHPQLIRIDHVFDYFQVDQGGGNFDFSRLDPAVNSILATGAVPMLSLSYTPDSKAPQDWNQWYQLVKATARRYSVEKNISGIYYEVWNEPDLFGGWRYNKNPNYLTLYQKTAQAVNDGAAGSTYHIGGPATTGYYQNWIKALFRTATDNHLRLDFVSWHRYSKNIADYLADFENLNQILADYPQFFNIERLITEIGPNSEPDSWYDNSLSGVHLLSLVTQLSGKVHRLFSFEIVDGPAPRSRESSGWGLITHPNSDAKVKPRYRALEFLNQLAGQRLNSSGDGSFVTSISTKDGSKIQTLLVNYDPKEQHPETVPVTFLNLNAKKYLLKTSRYLGQTSSKNITTDSGSYTENIYLDPNTAVILELTPQ